MMNKNGFLRTITLIVGLMIVFAFVGCGDDNGGETTTTAAPQPTPQPIVETDTWTAEELAYKDRWWTIRAQNSNATLEHFSVARDRIVTVTIGGVAEPHENPNWNAWRISACYNYTAKANTIYVYKFRAKTESGTRLLPIQYYNDEDESVYLGSEVNLNNEWQTFEITGSVIPKPGNFSLRFMSANALGTYYVEVISIEEFIISASPLTENIWNDGVLSHDNDDLWFSFDAQAGQDYFFWTNSSYLGEGDGTKTVYLLVTDIYYSNLNRIDGNLYAWSAPITFTADKTDIIYVRVRPHIYTSPYHLGTFGIVYSTTNTRP